MVKVTKCNSKTPRQKEFSDIEVIIWQACHLYSVGNEEVCRAYLQLIVSWFNTVDFMGYMGFDLAWTSIKNIKKFLATERDT